jgi:hypothetical protein
MTAREVDELGSDMAIRILNLRIRAEQAATVRIYDQMVVHMQRFLLREEVS